MKKLSFIILVSFIVLISAQAQIQTITVTTNSPVINGLYSGGVVNVASNSVVRLKSVRGPSPSFLINLQGATFSLQADPITAPLVIAGPATIQIQQSTAYAGNSFATLDVEPGPFPPGKTATVGANAGNVQVTMQMSTDLVNWTTATNGMVYTNTPDARFFRIQLVTNASP